MAKIGRPKGATNIASRAVKDLIDEAVDMKDVIDKLIELVEGVEVEEHTKSGTVVYTQKPDAYAAKLLLEYRYGKPSQSVDVTTKGEAINQPIIINPVASVQLAKSENEVDTKPIVLEPPTQ